VFPRQQRALFGILEEDGHLAGDRVEVEGAGPVLKRAPPVLRVVAGLSLGPPTAQGPKAAGGVDSIKLLPPNGLAAIA